MSRSLEKPGVFRKEKEILGLDSRELRGTGDEAEKVGGPKLDRGHIQVPGCLASNPGSPFTSCVILAVLT